MTQRRVSSWWAQWTCVGGTCAPATAAPSNSLEARLDAFTGLTAPVLRGCWAIPLGVAVAAVSAAAGRAQPGAGMGIASAYCLIYAAYCLANFARCREAHCIVTGVGWAIIGFAGIDAALTGRGSLNALWIAFVVVFIAGHGFEALWKLARGTNELRRPPRHAQAG